jgi:hypothetical protein
MDYFPIIQKTMKVPLPILLFTLAFQSKAIQAKG